MLPDSTVVLITGASRGIGRAIALHFAQIGAQVAINYRQNAVAAEETAAEVVAAGGQALLLPADVANATAVAGMFDTLLKTWGRIDVLVNNAGIVRDTLLLRMSEDDWDQVLDTNLRSAFLCTRAALRPMLRQRSGRIINISSISGVDIAVWDVKAQTLGIPLYHGCAPPRQRAHQQAWQALAQAWPGATPCTIARTFARGRVGVVRWMQVLRA